MKLFYLTISLSCFSFLLSCANGEDLPVVNGLFLDLDAEKEVEVEDKNRVRSWRNQIKGNVADVFVKQDEGRVDEGSGKRKRNKFRGKGSGRPTLKTDVEAIGGFNTLIFEEQELVNHQEDAFDHMTQGSGYTWFSVMCVYKQRVGKKDVNSFFGNLTNGKPYAGFWGNLMDDNRAWMGTRTGDDFGIKRAKGESPLWHKELNPLVATKEPLEVNRYYLIAGRMGKGTEKVDLEIFVNSTTAVDTKQVPVSTAANPSKMCIGQERDAINHPGLESFHGELARFLIFERPLSDDELMKIATYLKTTYLIK